MVCYDLVYRRYAEWPAQPTKKIHRSSGKLSYNLPVKIDSRFSGEIKATELLVVGPNAVVDAQISARHLKLEGKLIGNVQVIGCFEILSGGHFQGDARVGELMIHPGAVFEGTGLILGGD